MKRAVKWTSTVDGLEKCSLVDINRCLPSTEKKAAVDVDQIIEKLVTHPFNSIIQKFSPKFWENG